MQNQTIQLCGLGLRHSMSSLQATFFESISVSSSSADASADVVYTVPNNLDAHLDLLIVTNSTNSNQNISIQVYHADDASYHYLLNTYQVDGNNFVRVIEEDRLHLHPGDKILAYKGGGTFDVSTSGRLTPNPNRG